VSFGVGLVLKGRGRQGTCLVKLGCVEGVGGWGGFGWDWWEGDGQGVVGTGGIIKGGVGWVVFPSAPANIDRFGFPPRESAVPCRWERSGVAAGRDWLEDLDEALSAAKYREPFEAFSVADLGFFRVRILPS